MDQSPLRRIVRHRNDDGRPWLLRCLRRPRDSGPRPEPFHTALGTGASAKSTLRLGEKTYYQVQATPVVSPGESIPCYLLVSVRDISAEILQQQKLNAIYQAGLELGDLAPQELLDMTVQDRVELLKSRIIHYTKDLLEFETVEIRLLDRATQRLEPLLTVGMVPGGRVARVVRAASGQWRDRLRRLHGEELSLRRHGE